MTKFTENYFFCLSVAMVYNPFQNKSNMVLQYSGTMSNLLVANGTFCDKENIENKHIMDWSDAIANFGHTTDWACFTLQAQCHLLWENVATRSMVNIQFFLTFGNERQEDGQTTNTAC